MNLSEFKAWFEGFTENLDEAPTTKQWERIQKKVKAIVADPTPREVIYRDYWRPYWQQYGYVSNTYGSTSTLGAVGSISSNSLAETLQARTQGLASMPEASLTASEIFRNAGRTEALSMDGAA